MGVGITLPIVIVWDALGARGGFHKNVALGIGLISCDGDIYDVCT